MFVPICYSPTGDTMNPLNDHELLRWAMRAGLTRDEVRQAVRPCLDAGHISRQRADETQVQPVNLDMEAIWVVESVGNIAIGTYEVAGHPG